MGPNRKVRSSKVRYFAQALASDHTARARSPPKGAPRRFTMRRFNCGWPTDAIRAYVLLAHLPGKQHATRAIVAINSLYMIVSSTYDLLTSTFFFLQFHQNVLLTIRFFGLYRESRFPKLLVKKIDQTSVEFRCSLADFSFFCFAHRRRFC